MDDFKRLADELIMPNVANGAASCNHNAEAAHLLVLVVEQMMMRQLQVLGAACAPRVVN